VTDEDDLMIINKSGIVIRTAVEKLRVMGRATQGVKLIDLRGNDKIAAVTKVLHVDEEEQLTDENGNPIVETPESTTNENVAPEAVINENEQQVQDENKNME